VRKCLIEGSWQAVTGDVPNAGGTSSLESGAVQHGAHAVRMSHSVSVLSVHKKFVSGQLGSWAQTARQLGSDIQVVAGSINHNAVETTCLVVGVVGVELVGPVVPRSLVRIRVSLAHCMACMLGPVRPAAHGPQPTGWWGPWRGLGQGLDTHRCGIIWHTWSLHGQHAGLEPQC
jgi:hypothetical protein